MTDKTLTGMASWLPENMCSRGAHMYLWASDGKNINPPTGHRCLCGETAYGEQRLSDGAIADRDRAGGTTAPAPVGNNILDSE